MLFILGTLIKVMRKISLCVLVSVQLEHSNGEVYVEFPRIFLVFWGNSELLIPSFRPSLPTISSSNDRVFCVNSYFWF